MSVHHRHVGTELRAAREQRGLTLAQISASTRISIGVLEALEAGNVRRLPGGIFTRGFVRAYAREVGLDPEETVRQFLEEFPDETQSLGLHRHEAERESDALDPDFNSWRSLVFIGAATVGAIIMVAWVLVWLRGSIDAAASSEDPRPHASVVEASAGGSEPGDPSAVDDPMQPVTPPPPPAPVYEGITVTLAPEGQCWARIISDGQRSFQGLMPAGARETREARERLVLTVGDAGACRFILNGRPARPLGRPGAVVTARITRDNVQAFWE
ncbi:MAG TPA: RodZ domain-containing protein [Vicinamibacterales bacterium]